MEEPHRRETAEAHRVPLLVPAAAYAGGALAGYRAVAPVLVPVTLAAEHSEGLARVSQIGLVNSGPKWHCSQGGVPVLELPQGEGSR